jgi:MoxR-like ATPase
MCERFQLGHPIESLQPVTSPELILKCQETVRAIRLEADVGDAMLKLVRATREHPSVLLGASPRGSLGLFRLAQAMTAMAGNESVPLAQVWELAEPVLAHRLIVRPEQTPRYRHGGDVIKELVAGARLQ